MPTGEAFSKVLETLKGVKTALFTWGAVFFTCFVALASGITVPEGSRLNVDSGELHLETDAVPGSVINHGIIRTTTGKIVLNGDWVTVGVGSYVPGTGTVNFSGTTVDQTIYPGAADTFFDLTHSSTAVLQIQPASNPLNINGTFRNLSGKFKANVMTMNVAGDWINTAPAVLPDLSFEHGGNGTNPGNVVNLTGGDQQIFGDTTFYDLNKHLNAAPSRTLTLEKNKTQTIEHRLTLYGYNGGSSVGVFRLALRSTETGVQANLNLVPGGAQVIHEVSVQDNNASGVTLVGRGDSEDVDNNYNWLFGSVEITWDGSVDDNWEDPYNWNLGIVPQPGDRVIIPTGMPNYPRLRQAVVLGSVDIRSGASLTLDRYNLTISGAPGTLLNAGTIVLDGNEVVTVPSLSLTDTGIFKYIGRSNGSNHDITRNFFINGAWLATFHALVIEEAVPGSTPDTFTIGSNLVVSTTAAFTAGSVVLSSGISLRVNGLTTVNGGSFNASAGNLALNSFVIVSGSLSAPTAGRTFTLSGNFTRVGGTFTPNESRVDFAYDSLNPNSLLNQTILGNVGFFGLNKTVLANDPQPQTLTFGAGDLVMVQHDLTLKGVDNPGDPNNPYYLNIVSTAPGVTPGKLRLAAGGVQDIQKVFVRDNDASGGYIPWGVLLVARSSPDHSDASYKNTNWMFGNTTFRWDGTPLVSATRPATDWDEPSNWDLGLVPTAGDSAIVRFLDETNGDAQIPNQPILSTNVSVGNLTLREPETTLTLNGHNLAVVTTSPDPAGVFTNNGTVYLNGGEVLNLVQDYNSGTFVYRGDGISPATVFNLTFPSTFFNLEIQNPVSGTTSEFVQNVDMTIYGSMTVGGASFDASAHSLDVRDNFTMTGGTFKAPGITKDFTILGDFTQTTPFAATTGFLANGGTVTFDGASRAIDTEQTIYGTTTFSGLTSRISAGDAHSHTLAFDAAGLQTITRNLELTGIDATPNDNLLKLRSTVTGTPAQISLQPGGLQTIGFVDVQDSNAEASNGLWLVARDSPDHSASSFKNTHWIFGIPTVHWTGTLSTDWNDPHNWDLGLVPRNGSMTGPVVTVTGDDVVISNLPNQPHLTTPPSAVNLRNMNIEVDATVYLDGSGVTLTGVLSNEGTVVMQGTEPVMIHGLDTDSGTFKYTGDDTVPSTTPITLKIVDLTGGSYSPLMYFNLVIADGGSVVNTFHPDKNLDIRGGLTVTGGVLDATDRSIALAGSMLLNGGTLLAPDTGVDATRTFTVLGNWTNTSGIFTANTGEVRLDGSDNITVSGNTSFYDFTVLGPAAGRTIFFTEGSNQTVEHALDMLGDRTNRLFLRSTTDSTAGDPTDWFLTILTSSPIVNNVDVRDSNAVFPGSNTSSRHYIMALNSQDQLNGAVSTNTHWKFVNLDIIAPVTGRTVDPVPVIVGHGVPGELLTLIDETGAVIATTIPDVNGNFRVVPGTNAANVSVTIKPALTVYGSENANQIIPVYDSYSGNASTITVVTSTGPDQVPVIISPADHQRLVDQFQTITGQAKANQSIYIVVYNAEGLVLTLPPDAYAGGGDGVKVGSDGTFAVPLTRALMRGHNFISVIVDGVSSKLFEYVLNDLSGLVFDSVSNHLVQNAQVYLYNEDGTLAVPGVDISPLDVNPYVTGVSGEYVFLTQAGPFRIKIVAAGYDYPSKVPDDQLPAGHPIVPGSRGELFSVGMLVTRMDQPLDGNSFMFKVEKKANKTEAKIGEVVTYTVTIESLMEFDTVFMASLVDVIPPGFKFMNGRAQLDGIPMAEPTGNRPLWFVPGDFAPKQKKILRYQLVIGSGVAPGNYENTASMKYTNGLVLSNRSTQTVKVTLDPLFDAGTVFGKVFYDWNENGRQDDPEYVSEDREEVIEGGVPNVRLVMEDGTVVTADVNGQFHIPMLLPGRHLVRLDERSLPPGAYLTTDKVQVVDVTPGSIFKVNFGVNMDNTQIVGKDAEFFQREFVIDQTAVTPTPKLNVNVFNDNILLHNDTVIEQIEFRIFTNYAPFLMSWQLDVIDADTKKVVRSFTGDRRNIYDPVFWDGRDAFGKYLRSDFRYAYVLKVKDGNDRWDETMEQPLVVKVLTDKDVTERQRQRSDQEKTDEANARANKYRVFLTALSDGNVLKTQNIWVKGDTVVLKSAAANIRQVRVLKDGELFTEVPIPERNGLTARELLNGGVEQQSIPMEVILPDGDYELEVVSAEGSSSGGMGADAEISAVPSGTTVGAGEQTRIVEPPSVQTARYKRPLKVGQDYLMFVAMGDGKAGYNMNRGNIEPVGGVDKYKPGFYTEGKMAYYLKGKIKGKYIVTSSFDTDRQRKEALRSFKDEEYYPIYGDASTINYDATNTEGPLYLAVDWDKSKAIWGNYAVAFNDVEFANYTRTLYGGKLDYKTVATTDYGEAKTNVVVFHAEVRQRSAHNEFLGTGGSLYYFKHQDVVQGTDSVKLEVRDAVTGLVKSTTEMKSGVDYDMDYANGRVLFWRPVSMSVNSGNLMSNSLLSGDPVYVVANYEYFVQDKLVEATRGGRVTQAVGKNVVVGGTYVSETQADRNYQLKGQDVTVHLGKNATVKAEYAETMSGAQNNYISTDGGITFAELSSADNSTGKAYGISQDARLFDRVGLKSYYKWIGDGFSTGGTASQQGKELKGMAMTFDLTPVTRLTASRDIQRLIDRGNLQTAMQVGAKETITTLVQVVHDARRLRLTEEFRSVEVKGAEGVTMNKSNTLSAAAQAEYALNEKTDLILRHEAALSGAVKQATTVGVTRQITDKLSANLEETFSTDGTATKIGATANVTPKLAINTDFTLAQTRAGETAQTVALGGRGQINDNTSLEATTSVTQTGRGVDENAVALAATSKIDNDTDVKFGVESTQAADITKARQALIVEGAKKGKEGRETTTGVRLEDGTANGKTTVITAGEKGQINPTLQMATERSFGFGGVGQDRTDAYKIIKTRDGRNVETSYARKLSDTKSTYSDSNIFGLSGDINDRVAVQTSLEKGQAMNVDGSIYSRIAIAGALGYVEKDRETGNVIFQSSTKAEARLDKGVVDKQQYVFYQSAEGKVNAQTTVRGKFSYSTTRNMDTKKAEAGYKEIMLGAAYRPIAMDRVNLFGEYTYKENKGPVGQVATASDIEETKMHVLSVGAAFELNDKWELVERLAMRIMEEKVTGFAFAKTHTWLLVNRVNYALNKDWKIGTEYRILTVKEAKDQKRGLLVEAVHSVNDNVELGIGYNFTNFVDDLTNLSYTVQGPFIRMTGKLYDQSPEERARARTRWLEHRVENYAKRILKKEVEDPNSSIMLELNRMYQAAKAAQQYGKYEESREIYKNIITITQMMYEEAAQFVRQHIAYEEKIYNAYQRAREYYDKGDFWQARKLWEKIVEEASRAVLE
jgi:uncharacterized repeat protein (TIGR01451 family)